MLSAMRIGLEYTSVKGNTSLGPRQIQQVPRDKTLSLEVESTFVYSVEGSRSFSCHADLHILFV